VGSNSEARNQHTDRNMVLDLCLGTSQSRLRNSLQLSDLSKINDSNFALSRKNCEERKLTSDFWNFGCDERKKKRTRDSNMKEGLGLLSSISSQSICKLIRAGAIPVSAKLGCQACFVWLFVWREIGCHAPKIIVCFLPCFEGN